MKEYRFHWQTWVGVGILFLLALTMFLPDGQVQTESGSSVMRISLAKWALTVEEEEIDISRMKMEEGKKIDNSKVVPVLRMWGFMILLPIVLIIVSLAFMLARRRTFSGLLIANGFLAFICELIIRIRVPAKLFWEENFTGFASVIVLALAFIVIVYGILCIAFLQGEDEEADEEDDYDEISGDFEKSIQPVQSMPVRQMGLLMGVDGEYARQTVEIHAGEEIILGRDPKYCMLVFRNPKISRKQCGIRYDSKNGYYQAIDYSSNGTTLSDGSLLSTSEYTTIPPGTILYMAGGQESIQLM